MTLVLIVLAVVIVAAVLVLLRRRRTDPVDSFRRQIDALSPEARRPTIDQVRRADDETDGDGDDED